MQLIIILFLAVIFTAGYAEENEQGQQEFLREIYNEATLDPLYRVRHSKNTLTFSFRKRLYIIPEKRLMFCWIDKNACRNFNMVLNVVANESSRNEKFETLYSGSNDPGTIFDPKGYSLRSVLRGVEAILRNESWHKAVFYRHPVDRFVSAYKSQCTDNIRRPRHCHDTFHFPRKPTFAETVNFTARQQGRTFGSPHWRKQSEFCGGLDGSLHLYQTRELLDPMRPEDTHHKVRGMLQNAGVPITDELDKTINQAFPRNLGSEALRREHARFEVRGVNKTVKSSVTSFGSEDTVDFFRSQGLTGAHYRTILHHYMDDMLLFGIPLRPKEIALLRDTTRAERIASRRENELIEAPNVLYDFGILYTP